MKIPSFPTCHPYPHPYLHYLIIIFPSFKPQNTTTIISDVQLKSHRKHPIFQPPSLSSSSLALSHDYLSLIQTSKYNHHLRCAINHIENTPFSNLHPYPHHHLHYIIIIFPTIKPQNTTTIISDVQLITKKTTSFPTSIFRKDHPFLPILSKQVSLFVSKGPKTNIFAQKRAQLHTLELIF